LVKGKGKSGEEESDGRGVMEGEIWQGGGCGCGYGLGGRRGWGDGAMWGCGDVGM